MADGNFAALGDEIEPSTDLRGDPAEALEVAFCNLDSAKLRISRAPRGVPHCAMLLLIGVSPNILFCQPIVGQRRRSSLRTGSMSLDLVSILR